ncbi:MAG: 5'-nucleotidase, partial [Gammaproteobacteria bacterium]|nr:5'-nucleotidase [Gammaproteobacteria bacterium]
MGVEKTNVHSLNAKPLVVAVSSRALFDLGESHKVFEEMGMAEYARYQRELENVVLEPGHAFSLVRKLLALNAHRDLHPGVE